MYAFCLGENRPKALRLGFGDAVLWESVRHPRFPVFEGCRSSAAYRSGSSPTDERVKRTSTTAPARKLAR
jgi:hypothetical protein